MAQYNNSKACPCCGFCRYDVVDMLSPCIISTEQEFFSQCTSFSEGMHFVNRNQICSRKIP